jgi:hypothetical protein
MGLIVLSMVCFPGLYDSNRRSAANRHYMEAPSAETIREREQATRLDHRNIFAAEFVMLGIFSCSLYAFVRSGRFAPKQARPQ